MKKILLFVMLTFYNLNAQVGINTIDPKSALDITISTPGSPNSNDGILIPRLNAFPSTNPAADQNSMMVFLTTDLTGINISGTPQDYSSGYYYWDNSQTNWIGFLEEGTAWTLEGNTINGTEFIGTLNNHPFNIHVSNNKRISITADGQIVPHNTNNAILIGASTVGGDDAVVIGDLATANASVESVVIGKEAETTGDYGIAIGDTSESEGQGAIVIGRQSSATGDQSTVVGYTADATNVNGTAIGAESNSSGVNSSAIGYATASSGANSIAAGSQAVSSASNSTAIGHQAEATASSSTALGFESEASATQTIALGSGAGASRSQSMAIGFESIATGSRSIAIGYEAQANNFNSVAIGNNATVNSNNTIVLGNTAVTSVVTSGQMSADSFLATGTNTTYADYVFEDYFENASIIKPSYKFPKLEAAEKFVKKNGHLPGVKSYTEVMKNGFKLDLTEATITNLEKIEEQFIYITQLHKTIKTQEEKIESLEKRLKRIEARLD